MNTKLSQAITHKSSKQLSVSRNELNAITYTAYMLFQSVDYFTDQVDAMKVQVYGECFSNYLSDHGLSSSIELNVKNCVYFRSESFAIDVIDSLYIKLTDYIAILLTAKGMSVVFSSHLISLVDTYLFNAFIEQLNPVTIDDIDCSLLAKALLFGLN
ncbi:MAG TPA: hypothetical protein V6C58_08320 [Allocoleopsis sp.]